MSEIARQAAIGFAPACRRVAAGCVSSDPGNRGIGGTGISETLAH